MALRTKKQKKLWIWLAYSRARKRVIACEVGSRGVKTLKKLWGKVSLFKPDVVCTDNYKAYNRVIPNDILVQSKRYTHNIEAQNSSLRDFIKRYNRKTKAYSKAYDMAELSLYIYFFYILINKNQFFL